MRATIHANGVEELYESVLQAGPTGNGQYFGVVQEVKEELTPAGLVARVSGYKKHTLIPTRAIERAVIEE